MLNKNQSNKRNSWKYAVVLPLLGAFLFLFQIEVSAQEKPEKKSVNKNIKPGDTLKLGDPKKTVDLTKLKLEKDLDSLSSGKEIFIDGKKSTKEELAKLDPRKIKNISVNKNTDLSTLEIDTKNKPIQIKVNDKDIYIDGSKVTQEDFDKLDPNEIESVDVTKNLGKGTIRIVTKKFSKTLNENTIYINEVKVDKNELLLLDQNTIQKMVVNKEKSTISITTKEDSKKEKEVNGWKVSAIPAKEDIKQDKEVNGWIVGYAPNGTGNAISRIIDDKKMDYKKAVILIDGKKSDYKSLEKINPNDVERVIQADVKNASEENKNKAIQLYGKKVLNGF